MRILYKEPEKAPHTMIIPNDDLGIMQQLVDGYIEIVLLASDIAIVCNDEGKLRGMEANFYAEAIDDVICGPAFLCKIDGEDLTGISDYDVKWICNKLGWRC